VEPPSAILVDCHGLQGKKVSSRYRAVICHSHNEQRLEEAGRIVFDNLKRTPQLVLVILPQSAAELRQQVKQWGDVDRGIATQCVVSALSASGVRESPFDSLIRDSVSRKSGVAVHTVPMTSIAIMWL
jgi:hypothetical protein